MERECEKKVVYVCSAYSGDIEGNVEKARQFSRFVVDAGAVPITPHLYLPGFIKESTQRRLAMELNRELLKRCDELWAFGAVTNGMAEEIREAGNCNIPIRFFTERMEELA